MCNTTEICNARQKFAIHNTYVFCTTKITETLQNNEHIKRN